MKINVEVPVPVPHWVRRVASADFQVIKNRAPGLYARWPAHEFHTALCWLEGPTPDCARCAGPDESDDIDLSEPVTYPWPRSGTATRPYDQDSDEFYPEEE